MLQGRKIFCEQKCSQGARQELIDAFWLARTDQTGAVRIGGFESSPAQRYGRAYDTDPSVQYREGHTGQSCLRSVGVAPRRYEKALFDATAFERIKIELQPLWFGLERIRKTAESGLVAGILGACMPDHGCDVIQDIEGAALQVKNNDQSVDQLVPDGRRWMELHWCSGTTTCAPGSEPRWRD